MARFIVMALSVSICFLPVGAFAKDNGYVTVIHKKTTIRADKQFFAPAVAHASYMDKLPVIEEKGGWYKVSVSGKTGWVHKSAVSAGGKSAGSVFSLFGGEKDKKKVSQEDVALAGKGFNEQVEKKYKKKNPNVNFKAVDKMEKIVVKESRMASFIKKGKLKAREYED